MAEIIVNTNDSAEAFNFVKSKINPFYLLTILLILKSPSSF